MPNTIIDGSGGAYRAKVNSDLELVTRSTQVAQRLKSVVDSNYYEMHTASGGIINLSTATETPVAYLKNDDPDKILVIDRVFYDWFASTGGTGNGTWRFYRNPTVTGGSSLTPINTNFGSAETPTGTFTKSPATMSGTQWVQARFSASTSLAIVQEGIVLPQGGGLGISMTAPSGNTSMDVSINVAFYVLDQSLLSRS